MTNEEKYDAIKTDVEATRKQLNDEEVKFEEELDKLSDVMKDELRERHNVRITTVVVSAYGRIDHILSQK